MPQFSFGSGHFLLPYQGPASSTSTRMPNSPSSLATTGPPAPAPITMTAGSVFIRYPHFSIFLIKSRGNRDNLMTHLDSQLASRSTERIQGVDHPGEKTESNHTSAILNKNQTSKTDLTHR